MVLESQFPHKFVNCYYRYARDKDNRIVEYYECWEDSAGTFMDHLLVRIHLITEIILADRPCAIGD